MLYNIEYKKFVLFLILINKYSVYFLEIYKIIYKKIAISIFIIKIYIYIYLLLLLNVIYIIIYIMYEMIKIYN